MSSPGTAMPAPSSAYRPRFVVIFHERSEQNTSLLSTVRKVGHAPGIRNKGSQVALAAKGPTGAVTKVYERLRVAATDLNDEEFSELQANERVAMIVPNEVRSVPPIRPSTLSIAAALARDHTPGTDSPRTAFLDGMTAAINALRSFEGLSPLIAQPDATLAATAAALQQRTWGLEAIGITPNYHRATGKGVKVAVLDTGVNLHHPDFANKFQEGVNAVSFVPGDSVQDGHGHGTHCCGVVFGPTASLGGIRYGVAIDAEPFAGKVLNNQGTGTDDAILEAIDWAADQRCEVISMSLGSIRHAGESFAQAYETVAQQLLQEGIVIVAAAGNESDRPFNTSSVGNPAACPSILAVAAIDQQLRVANFSCGQVDEIGEVNLSAPGVGILSAFKGNQFVMMDGTSMATPHAAGCAALFREINPHISGRQLWDLLVQRAKGLGDRRDFGKGLVQVP